MTDHASCNGIDCKPPVDFPKERPMKAAELNSHHLGQRVTVSEGGNSVTGELSRVDHSGQVLTDYPVMQPEREVLGRTLIQLEFLGGYRANVTMNAGVTTHGKAERF